jgi:predicted nucleotidyltransferase
LRRHPALVGVAAGGSFATGRMDEFSDLDLVVVAHPSSWPGVLDQRRALAASLGPLLVSFTGEHVGEPRLLICLYGPPLTHVDLKFVAPADLRVRVEDPVLLWDRDGSVAAALAQGHAAIHSPTCSGLKTESGSGALRRHEDRPR